MFSPLKAALLILGARRPTVGLRVTASIADWELLCASCTRAPHTQVAAAARARRGALSKAWAN